MVPRGPASPTSPVVESRPGPALRISAIRFDRRAQLAGPASRARSTLTKAPAKARTPSEGVAL